MMGLLLCTTSQQFGSADEQASLVVQQQLDDFDDSEPRPTRPGVVSWSPPQPNWNPWLGGNIDEGPLATVSNISSCISKTHLCGLIVEI